MQRSLNHTPRKLKFSKKSRSLLRVVLMATMSVSSHMVKPVQESRSLWKVARLVLCKLPFYNYLHLLQTDSTVGMIPRAVEQVFRGTEQMKTKGWEYKVEGQFLEIVRIVSLFFFLKKEAP